MVVNAKMAEGEMENWGTSKTSLDTLDSYWNKLLEVLEYDNEREEVKFLLHSTTLKGKNSIKESGCLYGGPTDLPARAPLASYTGLKGVWMAPSPIELPSRSPYGTQRMVFRVGDIIKHLGTKYEEDTEETNDEEKWDAEDDAEVQPIKGSGTKKGGKKKDRKKKHREVNRKQKECYLKHKIPEKVELELPLLFFECTHHYGSTQYARLLLIRASDPKVEWCKQFCKEIELCDNPFFEFETGRVWTYKLGGRGRDIIVEILVVGDIVFEKLRQPPDWDVVGTLSRAGYDPKIGLIHDL